MRSTPSASPSIARANGISVRSSTVSAYVFAGFFYGAAALLLTAISGSGDPSLGSSLVITSFAAVVLGGTALGGGRGDAAAALIGAFIVSVIGDILFALEVPAFYMGVFNGGILLVAVATGAIRKRTGAAPRRWRPVMTAACNSFAFADLVRR